MLFCSERADKAPNSKPQAREKLQAPGPKSVVRLIGIFGVCVLMECPFALGGQLNSWTNPGSGKWQDLMWSLGQLPGPGQSIQITNSGWKAIQIESETAKNFAQNMAVDSVTLGGGTGTSNVLLLNFAGFQKALSVSQLIINSNSAVTALSSALTITNNVSVGGGFNQGASAVVSAGNLTIGDIGPGTY